MEKRKIIRREFGTGDNINLQNNNNSRYSLSEREKSHRNAQIIINIGKGIFRPVNFKDKISNLSQSEIIKNRQEWHNISSNRAETAKYSPYIKENYGFMIAKGIYMSSKFNLYSNPDISKMSESEFYEFTNMTKLNMISSFRASNLSISNCAVFIKMFEEDIKAAYMSYVRQSSELIYNKCLTMHADDLAFDLDLNLSGIDNYKIAFGLLSIIMQRKVLECLDLGIPKSDIALKILYDGIYNYVSRYSNLINSELFVLAFKSLQIADFKFTDYINNPDECIFKMVEVARKLYAENQEKFVENTIIVKTKQKEMMLKEFFNWYKSNKYAHPDEIDNMINELTVKYDVNDSIYLNSVYSSKSVLDRKSTRLNSSH